MAHVKKSAFKRFRHWLFDTWLIYAMFVGALLFFDLLPQSLRRASGRVVGWIWYCLDQAHRVVGLENLALAFPEKSEAERKAILKSSYIHLGLSLVDVCKFRRLSAGDIRGQWVIPEEGSDECARAAQALGRGVIGAGAHIGFWELSGFAFPALGYRSVCVARRIPAPRMDAKINAIRSRLGNEIIHQEGALRLLIRALKDNKFVGIIMDQYASSRSPWVPFFGRAASTIDTCARLHLKTGAPIVINLILRHCDGRFYWRCKNVAIPPLEGASEEQRVRRILEACNREFEYVIREYPEQWLWMHKRWKPLPKDGDKYKLRHAEMAVPRQ